MCELLDLCFFCSPALDGDLLINELGLFVGAVEAVRERAEEFQSRQLAQGCPDVADRWWAGTG